MNRLTNILWGLLHIFHIHHWGKWGDVLPVEVNEGLSSALGGNLVLLSQHRYCQYCNKAQEEIV